MPYDSSTADVLVDAAIEHVTSGRQVHAKALCPEAEEAGGALTWRLFLIASVGMLQATSMLWM